MAEERTRDPVREGQVSTRLRHSASGRRESQQDERGTYWPGALASWGPSTVSNVAGFQGAPGWTLKGKGKVRIKLGRQSEVQN